ncbi:hypothetical protein K438DRAFT_1767367 [Mycena galopus ATCC 62051]|nr:hypothetical protein K438DRAFT_1767367 [Mycena galopus ATCC 62051]
MLQQTPCIGMLIQPSVPSLLKICTGTSKPLPSFPIMMRARYTNQQVAFLFLELLGGALGAYTISHTLKSVVDNPVWPDIRFKQDFLYQVLNLKISSTTEIDSWFSLKMLEGTLKVNAWVKSGGVTNSSKFDKMKTSDEFKHYLIAHHKPDLGAVQLHKHKRR